MKKSFCLEKVIFSKIIKTIFFLYIHLYHPHLICYCSLLLEFKLSPCVSLCTVKIIYFYNTRNKADNCLCTDKSFFRLSFKVDVFYTRLDGLSSITSPERRQNYNE